VGCSQGVHRGRKKALRPDRVVELLQKAQAGESKTRLAQAFGISRETVYQYLRECGFASTAQDGQHKANSAQL
jgi:DNA invertase Pin-like site-specific DNA recombinase